MTGYGFHWTPCRGSGGGPPKELIWLLVGIGAMAAVFLAVYNFVMSILPLLFTVALVFALAAVAGAVYALRRRMAGRPLLDMQSLVQFRELDIPAGQPWILGAQAPKALPQVTNNYFGGQHVHGGVDGLPVVRGELIPNNDN